MRYSAPHCRFEPYTLTFPENEGTTESTASSTKETSSVSTTSTEKERVFARKAKDWAKAKAGVVHTVRMVCLYFNGKYFLRNLMPT